MMFLSKTAGIGGEIKRTPEDFIVKEITPNGTTLEPDLEYGPEKLGEKEDAEGKFTRFVLQKRDWDTTQILMRMAKVMGRGRKSIGFYGTKDRASVSVQLAGIFGVTPEQLKLVRIKDMKVNGAWKSTTGPEMGGNLGNAFNASITGCTDAERVGRIIEELDSKMPNYYDRQRFGMRLNNFGIGMCIIHGDFEGAAMKLLTDTKFETNQGAVEARKKLEAERDFKAALEYFPRNLRNERTVIEYMSRYDNFANALRKLPRGILLMFVHSVQSFMFNAALQERIKEGDFDSDIKCRNNFYGFPDIASAGAEGGEMPLGNLVGYETKQEVLDEYEKGIMEKIGLSIEDFKVKAMPELSPKGSYRAILSPVKDISCETDANSVKVGFSIPAGAYATVLLNEITKSDDLKLEDIHNI